MGTVFKDRVAKGLCGYCGKENDNLPLKYCKACAEKRSRQNKERKEYYERHGWCNVCGNPEKNGEQQNVLSLLGSRLQRSAEA